MKTYVNPEFTLKEMKSVAYVVKFALTNALTRRTSTMRKLILFAVKMKTVLTVNAVLLSVQHTLSQLERTPM